MSNSTWTVISASQLDRIYALVMGASAPRTLSSITGAKLTRHQTATIGVQRPVTVTPYKTGDRSVLQGITSRTAASFSWSGPLIPNGTTLTAPDTDPFFQGVFGQASTSGVYSFVGADQTFLPIALVRYIRSGGTAANLSHQLVGGAAVSRMTITFGGEHLMMSVEGKAVAVFDNTQTALYTGNDVVPKFGFSAFPTEPSSPAVYGNPINGFGGTATFDGTNMMELRGTFSITINTGLDILGDGYQDGYGFAIVGGKRMISLSRATFADDDGSALANLKAKCFSKSPINLTIVIGSLAGQTIQFALKNVQLNHYQIVENGPTFDCNFDEAPAHESTIGAVDDLAISFL
jgi:hypothetical protein